MAGQGRPIKKGQILNPKGPGKGIAKKALKIYTQILVAETFNKLINYSRRELEPIFLPNSEAPMIEQLIAKAMCIDLRRGTTIQIERILERIIGPVPIITKGEYTGRDGEPLMPPAITFAPFMPTPLPIISQPSCNTPQNPGLTAAGGENAPC